MKVIDILNKMANDEDYRPTVVFSRVTFTYNTIVGDYENDRDSDCGIFANYVIENILNDEVEVIEENKEIEELGFIEETVKYCDGTGHTNKVNNMASYSDIVISTNEYRPCFAYGQKGLFHRWIIKHDVIYKDEYVKGLVEFENGHVAEVGKEDIQFCDNKFKEYNFKEREEK